MDLILGYGEDEDKKSSVTAEMKKKMKIDIAPVVRDLKIANYTAIDSRAVDFNPEYDAMWSSAPGAYHPVHSKPSLENGMNNTLTGFVEDAVVDSYAFEEQLHAFNNRGYALDPTGQSYIYNPNTKISLNEKHEKRKRKKFGNAASSDFQGPWAPYEDEERIQQQFKKDADFATENAAPAVQADAEARQAKEAEHQREKEEKEAEENKLDEEGKPAKKEVVQAKSIYHGIQVRDYLGRSFVDPPSHLKQLPHECFLPKAQIHTWAGHTKGVSTIQFLPKYGHLILSAGMDTKVKVWDVYNKMECLRTYMGHSKAVRDVSFSNDGRRFLSCSYDKNINLWDTETGECLASFSNGRIPYTVRFHPDDNRQNVFLAGGADKKILQWDCNSGKITQEYYQHLGAINTVTFIDGGRRFISTSDDKSIRVWEWGIPVVIKYISEPHMHSMPAVAVHPDGQWFACQSLDNQILVYSTKDRFRMNKKKIFKGHVVAGYACQLDFSPDGHWLVSGDSDGKLWFWDWNTTRVLKTLKAHDGVSIGVKWHPIDPSRVASCGWDSMINYWD
jgi:pre-mRNA-processing factor 17